MRKRLVILDFDGTLGDTNGIITKSMQATLAAMGLPQRSPEACSKVIGLPLAACFSTLLPISQQQAEACAQTYRRIFAENNQPGLVPLFPHVRETMAELHRQGVSLSIASSRNRGSLQQFVEDLGLHSYISFVLGADDVTKAKPDPQPVLLTLTHYGMQPDEALVVGDMSFDILMGRRAGCDTCGVTYGNGNREELLQAGATHVIDDFQELLQFAIC